ncbi:346_t:CDS:2 [Funneliformis mosseae]|uniref:346_t:CDS:1 n=1 Tax=Funneliformis mosseae TaxID=27381 RepID=A0A9N8VVB0_FUNMO|nr:346_t:CDS:2 [Funneliformis mosseae]
MSTEVIIPGTLVHLKDDQVLSIIKEDNCSIDVQNNKIEQGDLDTPPTPGSLNPPPPYSKWDELSIEQLLEKSREVLIGHTEYLANGGGDEKEKNGEVINKMTQLESLVSSLQSILSDQTFAMHDLRSQLSDIQTVLKKMQDKQDTMTSEEVMKQVVTMKALTENIMASSEIKKQLDASNAAKLAAIKQQQYQQDLVVENKKIDDKIIQPSSIEELHHPTHSLSAILLAPPGSLPINPKPRSVSRQPSRAVSRTSSRNPSRPSSRPSSRPASRTVSPSITPVSLSRTSSRNRLELPSSESFNKIHTIDENCEDEDDDDESFGGDTQLDRMLKNISSLLSEATEAVELPVKGREKDKRTVSNVSASSFDMNSLKPEDAEFAKEGRWPKKHKRTKSNSNKDDFLKSLNSFSNSMTGLENLVAGLTEEIPEDESDAMNGIQYRVSTNDLINNPSSDVPDLDDFTQQCRLLTRALILPFLHATHSFMSESLQTTSNVQAPRSVTSTTRTFMNLMYWTFLFTLGSLVLDAWLCEVAGRQVIRMVELLKPGQPFGMIPGYGGYDMDQQDGGIGMLEDGKKKNVKFRTGPKMKAVTWKGVEKEVVGSRKGWLKEGAQFLTSGRWGMRSTVGRFEDEEYSEESDEWEIVDFDDSDGEESVSEEEDSEEDPALLLRRRITNERLRRAGHVKSTHENDQKNGEEIAVNNGTFSVKEKTDYIQDESKISTEPQENCEMEDIVNYMDQDEEELKIPGSFPTAFKWTPPPTTLVDITESVRRVRSVVLRKPKRSGPFGGSGEFWVMNTRKVRTLSKSRDNDVLKSSNKSSSIKKKKISKASPNQKRTWGILYINFS